MPEEREDVPEASFKVAGQEARFRGYRIMDVIACVATVAFFGMIYLLYLDFKATVISNAAGASQEHKKVSDSIEAMRDAISDQTYVMTLSQPDKERLNLGMPDSLRRKVNNR